MPDKLTDKEIVKALECCSKGVNREVCEECVFRNSENKININCFNLEKYALDLINRLQSENKNLMAEVEKQKKKVEMRNFFIEEQKAENERLKNAYKQVAWERDCFEADNKRLYEIIENKNIKTEEQ